MITYILLPTDFACYSSLIAARTWLLVRLSSMAATAAVTAVVRYWTDRSDADAEPRPSGQSEGRTGPIADHPAVCSRTVGAAWQSTQTHLCRKATWRRAVWRRISAWKLIELWRLDDRDASRQAAEKEIESGRRRRLSNNTQSPSLSTLRPTATTTQRIVVNVSYRWCSVVCLPRCRDLL